MSFSVVCTTAMTAGSGYILGMSLNLGLWQTQVLASPVWSTGVGEIGQITGTAFLNIGDPVAVQVQNQDAVARDFRIIEAAVQLIT